MVVFLLRFGGMFLAYLMNFFVANTYGKEIYGNFATSLTILEILGVLASLGLAELMIKLAADVNFNENGLPKFNYLNKSVYIVFISSIVFSGIYYFLSEVISTQIFDEGSLNEFFKILAFFLPFFALHLLFTSNWQGVGDFVKFGIFRFLAPYLVFFLVYFSGVQLENILFFYLIGFPLLMLIEMVLFRKKLMLKDLQKVTHTILIKKSVPMMLSSMILLALNWSDILMIGIMRDQAEVGDYQAAFKIASLSLLIIIVSNVVIAPKISEMFSKEQMNALFSFLRKATQLISVVTLVISLPLIFLSDFVISFLFGQEFIGAAPIMVLLLVANVINTFFGPTAQVMNMTKHQLAFQNITIFVVMVNIILNLFLIEKHGAYGCAIATIVSISLLNIISTWFLRKKYQRIFFLGS